MAWWGLVFIVIGGAPAGSGGNAAGSGAAGGGAGINIFRFLCLGLGAGLLGQFGLEKHFFRFLCAPPNRGMSKQALQVPHSSTKQ